MIENNIKSQACALNHMLGMGLIEVEHVVSWADNLNTEADILPDWLTELALCKTINQAMTCLGQTPGELPPEHWWPLLKQQIAKELNSKEVNRQAVVTYCYNLALSGEIPAYDCEALYQLELEYDSIFTGYGTQSEVDAQALQFFNKHKV